MRDQFDYLPFPLLIWTTGIAIIWYYKRMTKQLRKKAGLPELYDKDDLPDPIFDPNYVHVLTDKQQYELHHRTISPHCSAVQLCLPFMDPQSKRSL